MNNLPNFNIIDILKIKRTVPNSIITKNKFCCILSCRTNGECTFKTDAKTFTAKIGDVVFVPASLNYTQYHTQESLICFHFFIDKEIKSNIQIHTYKDPAKMVKLFQKAESIWNKKGPLYQYACLSILYEIISKTGIIIEEEPEKIPQILEDAISYINSNMFETSFSIENCLSEINVSRTYLNKLFKKHFNITPISYVNNKRLNRAKQLIRTENYTNDIIANLCGFKETVYFYHFFKKNTGMTPKEYKKNKNMLL